MSDDVNVAQRYVDHALEKEIKLDPSNVYKYCHLLSSNNLEIPPQILSLKYQAKKPTIKFNF